MQHMQMRMKLPLKHNLRCAQHFAKVNLELCQASEMEILPKQLMT